MRNERFEWDDEKARKNLLKYGVSFEEAALALDDASAIIEIDDSDPYEERWRTIGLAWESILFVVSTERHGGIIRIISARTANRNEQDRYNRQALPER